jgi:hypothetical protein
MAVTKQITLEGQCCLVWYKSVNVSEENTILRVELYDQQSKVNLGTESMEWILARVCTSSRQAYMNCQQAEEIMHLAGVIFHPKM